MGDQPISAPPLQTGPPTPGVSTSPCVAAATIASPGPGPLGTPGPDSIAHSFVSGIQPNWSSESQSLPQEDSNPLQDFRGLEGLYLRGFAPAVSRPRVRPQPRAIQEAMWEHARGGENIQKVPMDKILVAQEVESGGFKAHDIPSGLITHQKLAEVEAPLRSAQQQQGALGLVLAKGMANLDVAIMTIK